MHVESAMCSELWFIVVVTHVLQNLMLKNIVYSSSPYGDLYIHIVLNKNNPVSDQKVVLSELLSGLLLQQS